MIGNFLPPSWRRQDSSNRPLPVETFRLELRRGCLALAVLAELRREGYGYALRQSLARRGLEIEPGTLYPLLKRLESLGLLASEWRADGKRRKRFYVLSPDGWRMLDQLLAEWAQIDSAVSRIVSGVRDKAA